MKARCIDEGNLTHTDDTYGRCIALTGEFVELGGNTKEEGALYFEHIHACGDSENLVVLAIVVHLQFIGEHRNGGAVHNTLHKYHNSHYKAHLDSKCKVEKNREQQGYKQHTCTRHCSLAHRNNRAPATHII